MASEEEIRGLKSAEGGEDRRGGATAYTPSPLPLLPSSRPRKYARGARGDDGAAGGDDGGARCYAGASGGGRGGQ